MQYSFKESYLPAKFASQKLKEVKQLINSGISFTVCGIPGVGVTIFLRYLATLDFAHFVFIDVYKLPQLTKSELFKTLLSELGGKVKHADDGQIINECSKILHDLTQKEKVVIIFNRFDTLKKEIDKTLFTNLSSLWEADRQKVVFIFTGNRPIVETAAKEIGGGYLYILSKNFYFKTYSFEDLKDILDSLYPGLNDDQQVTEKALKLSGGHHQLFHLLLKSVKFENPLEDLFIRLQLKEIYENFTYAQRKMLQNIVKGKIVENIDPFLEEIGVIAKYKSGIKFFTPLLKDYIEGYLPLKLPIKESKLFNLFKKNEGRIVFKHELFEAVWPNDDGEASDWALNSLIYRIRMNPVFKTSGYAIESYKKQGYKLIKS